MTLVASMELHGPYGFLFSSPMAASYLFHGATALLFLALTPFVFKRLGFALGAYVLASLLLPLSGSDLTGIGRYASVESKAERVAANGRPLGRGGVTRDKRFSPSTRVGCSRTGPGLDSCFRFGRGTEKRGVRFPQSRDARSHVSDRAQLSRRSSSTSGDDRPCSASARCRPKSDQPLCGWSSSSSR